MLRRNITPPTLEQSLETDWRARQYVLPKCLYLPRSLNGVNNKRPTLTSSPQSERHKLQNEANQTAPSVFQCVGVSTQTFNRCEWNASRSDLLEAYNRDLAPGLAQATVHVEIDVSCSKQIQTWTTRHRMLSYGGKWALLSKLTSRKVKTSSGSQIHYYISQSGNWVRSYHLICRLNFAESRSWRGFRIKNWNYKIVFLYFIL